MESTSETARFRQILSKSSHPACFLEHENGRWALSSEESLDILLDSYFPACSDSQAGVNLPLAGEGAHLAEKIVTRRKVEWAVNNFQPYKSPGLDGIIPAQLQRSLDVACSWLVPIFRGCITLGYTPKKWKRTKVVFIPKAGKRSHTSPKDYRPISLSSFLLKTLERLLDLYIRDAIPQNMFSASQHAYVRGMSVDSALYTLVNPIEGAPSQKERGCGGCF